MLFNSEISILPNRRKLRKTIFVSEYSTEFDCDNSQTIELNKTNHQDSKNQSKYRGSLLQNTKSETELHSVGIKKQSFCYQPSITQQEDHQNVITQIISAPQKFQNHRYSLNSFDKMENIFQSNNSRQSIQLQPAERRISYNDFGNNAQQNQQMPQLKNLISPHTQEDLNNHNNFPKPSQFYKNYFYPSQYSQQIICQSNNLSSSINSNLASKNSLRGTQSGFLLKNQTNIFQEDLTNNFQVNPTKNAQNALNNILSGRNLKSNNYDNNKYVQTRIKSLNNLSSTLKRIEELETNTSIKNDSNISIIQKSDRMIQFAKKHDIPLPNMAVSPLDLLKKQPSKGVLKNSSKTLINSQSNFENGEEDESIQSLKDNNMSGNNKSLGNLRNLKKTPSSLEEIPEIEINNYNVINQNQDFLPIVHNVQSRVRKIIRNGTVIKKVQNDVYEQKDDQSIQSEGFSPKKKQMVPSDIFSNAQSDGRLFEDVLSSSSSPKKRISKISIIQPII
ncbi:hypothetical protein ABPG72_000280 [Tetrahymena utriculariae]